MISVPFIEFALAKCQHNDFFGLIPWYGYLPDERFTANCNIKDFHVLNNSDIPLILLAVLDDLLRVAGIAAVIFVMVGAIQYLTSQGNPEDTAKARGTIINALVGLVIAMMAVALVSFLGHKLGG
jgi:hypothetical protein